MMGGENGTETEMKQSSSIFTKEERTPRFFILLCITMIAFGAAGGFTAFSVVFEREFDDSIRKMEQKHNQAIKVLADRLEVVISERQQCLDDPRKDVEIGALKGKLSAQEDLAEQYKELSSDYDTLANEIEALEKRYKKTNEEADELEDLIERKDRRIEAMAKHLAEQERQIEELIQDRDQNQQIKEEEMKQVQRSSSHLQEEIIRISKELTQTKEALEDQESMSQNSNVLIQQRQSSLCREEYGDGPYYISVWVKTPASEEAAYPFVIEIASRRHMPHSVFTFLTLVKYHFYNDYQLESSANSRSVFAANANPTLEKQSRKLRKLLGMEETVLMFNEESKLFPCDKNSVGFDGFGPSLLLFTASTPPEQYVDASCFGTVIRGEESFQSLGEAVLAGKKVEGLQMEYLPLE